MENNLRQKDEIVEGMGVWKFFPMKSKGKDEYARLAALVWHKWNKYISSLLGLKDTSIKGTEKTR